MKITKTTFVSSRSYPSHEVCRIVCFVLRKLGLFIVSLAFTLILIHFVFNRIAGYPIDIKSLFHPEALLPLIVLTGAVTIANSALLKAIRSRLGRVSNHTRRSKSVTPKDTHQPSELTRQVLRLTRQAERLNNVEHDLIRKISESYHIDATTQQLLTEMRVCTNRLRGQLSDFERQGVHSTEPANTASEKNN